MPSPRILSAPETILAREHLRSFGERASGAFLEVGIAFKSAGVAAEEMRRAIKKIMAGMVRDVLRLRMKRPRRRPSKGARRHARRAKALERA